MRLPSWRSWFSRRASSPRDRRTRLAVQYLENRTAPAVFLVNTFDDTVEAVRNGSGLDAQGNVSLRSAIMAANDLGGEHLIQLGAGRYQLSIWPEGVNGDDSGNLNVGRGLTQVNLTLAGALGGAETVIDAGYLDQVLSVGFFATTTVRNLTVENGYGTFGGVLANSGRLTLTDVTVRGGWASHGGGLFSNGTATLNHVRIEGNYASQGGGIHNGGTMTATTTAVEWNYAVQGGGIFNARTLTLERSTVADNFTDLSVGWGGGIFNQSDMTLTNSTLAENWSSTGGGIYTVGFGTATLVNSTLALNVAYGSPFSTAGGIFVGNGTPTLQLKNTLVAYNWSERIWDISGSVTSLGHNLVSVGTGATGFLPTDLVGDDLSYLDPLLGPLQDNGGPTRTMALGAGSVAINAGDSDGAPTVDQRGELRDLLIDIGAYEYLQR